MNRDAVSAVSQIVSGTAVFISLLYLAFQVRFARLAAADTSRTARDVGVRENVLAMTSNSGLCENWLKASGLRPAYEMLGGRNECKCGRRGSS